MNQSEDPVVNLFSKIPNIPNGNIEFECRFYIDSRAYPKKRNVLSNDKTLDFVKNLIAKHQGDIREISQTINLLTDDRRIKQMTFINGIQQKDKLHHYTKVNIINSFEVQSMINYKIAIAYENDIEPFETSICNTARIKLRYSITVNDWRIDITLIANIKSLLSSIELKERKTEMFFDIPIDEFVDKAPWNDCDHIEVELEYIGNIKNLTIDNFTNGIKLIAGDVDAARSASDYTSILYQLAKKLNIKTFNLHSLKSISNQVIELNKQTFMVKLMNNINQYYLTDKVDGERTILYHIDGNTNILNSSNTLDNSLVEPGTYIFDTEQYITGVGEKATTSYYLFDVLMFDGQSLMKEPFYKRFEYFDKATKLYTNTNITIKQKPFKLITDIKKDIKEYKLAKKDYETDGFILTPHDGIYESMAVYKYKPIDKLTCDFLIKECPKNLLGIKPYTKVAGKTLYFLCCGVKKSLMYKLGMKMESKHYNAIFKNVSGDYIPTVFSPSSKKYAYFYWGKPNLEDQVGEFIVKNYKDDMSKYKWDLVRIREDKQVDVNSNTYFGNDFRIIELNWMSYRDPLVIEDFDIPSANAKVDNADSAKGDKTDNYFQVSESNSHKSSRAYNSFVKSKIINSLEVNNSILDLASGKGQDLFRYYDAGVKCITFVEYDNMALFELINRKFTIGRYKSDRSTGMEINIQQMDLNDPFKKNVDKLSANLKIDIFDAIICNLALHYMIANANAIKNIVGYISNYLNRGNKFIFTAFDGQAVYDLLAENKGKYSSVVDKKYEIVSKYGSEKFKKFGQKIDVILPFSNGEYYTEYLVNIKYLESVFKKNKIVLMKDTSFDEYLGHPDIKDIVSKMDDDDKLYVGLYHCYEFIKL